MSTRPAGLVIGILLAVSGTLATAQTKPATVAQTPAQIAALRAAQLAAQPQRMPNLVGQTLQSAQQDSQVRGLKLQLVPRSQPARNQKAGVIIGHEPQAGAAVRAGMTVTVFVAVAERDPIDIRRDPVPIPVLRVPLVEGMSVEQATDVLARRGLQIQPRTVLTTRARPGTVVDQTPEADTTVKPKSFVDVLVAQAPDRPVPETTFEMPRVIGMEIQQGAALLSKLNLGVQREFREVARAAPGMIVDQKPVPGAIVRRNEMVYVLVAQAPPEPPRQPESVRPLPVPQAPPIRPAPVDPGPTTPPPPKLFPMPDLVGRSFQLAERDPRVTELRLQLNLQIDTRAAGVPNTIARQSVSPGAGVQIGQAVTVFVASGVTVPRVLQQQADAATARIAAVGLTPRRTEETSDLTSGTVLRQVPEPGVLVPVGASVAITVAVPQRVTIPNVVGRTRTDAVQELARLRLRASPADDGASLLPPEQVVSQVPGAGTEVVVGAAVRILVATGVEVPNLSGLSADEAQRTVAERGLSFEDTDQETDAVPAGQVFQQQPASGTRVTRGTRVLATVAVAVPVVVPNVVGVTRQRAVALLDAAGLRADAAPDAGAASRLVERQQPAAQTRVARLTTVALFVAAPPQLPPTQQPEPLAPVPAPVPGPVPGPLPTPVPAVQVAPSAAVPVPVQPLLPPWLLTLLVALAAIGVSTFRLWWPGSSSPPPPPIQAATPATPPPAIDVRPERGDTSLRLEVTGRSLISMDVRVRVERGPAEQTLDVQGDALIVEERRLYE